MQGEQTIRVQRVCRERQGRHRLQELLYVGERRILTYAPLSLEDAIRFETETLRMLADQHNQFRVVTEILANCDACETPGCEVVAGRRIQ